MGLYKILLVDDEELERKVLSFTLQNSGLPVEIAGEASSGREGLKLAGLIKPDIIIMDIKMPGIDGIEATRRIKEIYPVAEIIILTAYGRFSFSQQAIKAQASDYLLKPVQPQQLIESVRQAIDKLAQRFQPGPLLDLARLEEQVKAGSLQEAKRQFHLLVELLAAKEPALSPALLSSFGLRVLVIAVQAVLSAGADPAKAEKLESELAQDLARVGSRAGLSAWGEGMLEKSILLQSQKPINDLIPVRKAIAYMEERFASELSLSSVAAKVHLSPAYLSRIFTKQTGLGFTEYLIKLRLKHAKHLLRTSDETIEQVAEAAGFSSNSYFTAVFKKHEGVTPSEYRARHQA